jgi:hypothetical protein
MPKFKAPDGVIGINIGGQQFNVDAQGEIELPDTGNYPVPFDYIRITPATPEPLDYVITDEV